MKYLPDQSQMKEADFHTIRTLGVPSLKLMERAAASCVEVMEEKGLDLSRVCIVCGSGNNGGDGFAIARILMDKGHEAEVFFVGKEESCTEETKIQMKLFGEAGGKQGNTYAAGEYSVIVDAVFGAGLNRDLEGTYGQVIDAMNASEGVKLAVDIPTGISADTGAVMGHAFQADITVALQAAKLGTFLHPGYSYAGEVIVKDIGIDESLFEKDLKTAFCYEPDDILKYLPKRPSNSHKGTFGRALVIAGSRGMAGAAFLGAYAAYMTGAGLVQIYTPEENRDILQTLLPEAIITAYDFYDEREILSLLRWADVVSIGSGLGTSDKSRRILKTTLENVEVPCVVDADGLNLLSENARYLNRLPHGHFIFTPHMKEMTRIARVGMEELKSRKMEILNSFVQEYPVTCVLKDARTYVACKNRHPYVNLSGNQSMAKAGAGDVLAGVITGLIAQGMDSYEGAALGVYIHGLAGDAAREKKGSYSVLARDLAESLSTILKQQEEV